MAFTKTCKLCGKEFSPKRDWQKFCCKEHQKEYWRQIYHGQHNLSERVQELEKKLGIDE